MPADHSETGSTAIHLVDLHDVVDFADALATFAEQALLVSERLFLLLGFGRRLLTVQLYFVVNLSLRRKQLGREIKWDARFCFCLVKCQPLAQQFIELRKPASQILHRLRFKREQLAIRERLYRRRTWRSVQDRQFTKEITLAIKREIAFLSVDSGEGSRSSFLKYVEGPGVVALTNNQIAFFDCDRF